MTVDGAIADQLQQQHNACMVSITIRDVPDGTRNELAARAARSGRSLQEFLRGHLVELASRPDRATVLARIADRVEREGTAVSVDDILEARDADRR
jgi:plasmid stability protein